jgi:hypothetical protein
LRLWEDGFDHYGTNSSGVTTGTDNMLDGSYGNADASSSSGSWNGPTTTQFVTGTRSYFFGTNGGLSNFLGLRKVLPTPITKLGMTARFYFSGLPGTTYSNCIAHFLTDDSAVSHLSFYVDTNGAIRIVRGHTIPADNASVLNGTLLGTTDPLLTSNAWNHVEIQVNIHDSTGWVRIAINGIHRYQATGLDTKNGTSSVWSVGQNRSFNNASGNFYMDDYILYDFTGDSAVDTDFCPTTDANGVATSYIGELQVWPLFPNGDTAEADWLKSTGTDGYALIDELTPNDADYIYSTTGADLSEFALEDLPEEITYIRGLGIHARMSKSDSGAAMIKLGMKSVAATDDADERPITTTETYWRDPIDVDPNSGARWTRTSLNAAWLRLTRSI